MHCTTPSPIEVNGSSEGGLKPSEQTEREEWPSFKKDVKRMLGLWVNRASWLPPTVSARFAHPLVRNRRFRGGEQSPSTQPAPIKECIQNWDRPTPRPRRVVRTRRGIQLRTCGFERWQSRRMCK